MPVLFLLFILIPIVEITVLINVGQTIGTWYTVGLVLLSAFIGVNMLRYQGISTLARAQQRISSGEMPAQEMVEGLVLAVGGALLITPGFVTDFIGFCCLIPFTRQAFVKGLMKRFKVVSMSKQQPFGQNDTFDESKFDHKPSFKDPSKPPRQGDIIDGEFRRDD
ncbi:FxsA family protein [Neptunomonas japonica]|uniref:FxsA cytoplasmic membrane protein n=1 Tax=Neptunomonas japonica JAMM 1380 TaxID=1441457 RepID=A0A7R6SXC6_9GAMM|nr:FxsA family protein [Neptunomonas japonica]BBB30675.1 FxsA cytoplasmic membrane protein [Neptunomonas japonica JAMM 1380]